MRIADIIILFLDASFVHAQLSAQFSKRFGILIFICMMWPPTGTSTRPYTVYIRVPVSQDTRWEMVKNDQGAWMADRSTRPSSVCYAVAENHRTSDWSNYRSWDICTRHSLRRTRELMAVQFRGQHLEQHVEHNRRQEGRAVLANELEQPERALVSSLR